MDKPEFRDNDENPKRSDDVRFKGFGFEAEASGKNITTFIMTLSLVFFVGWHDWKDSGQHDRMTEAQTLNAALVATGNCIAALNEMERYQYRTEGKYCHDALREVREYLRRQDALPEKHAGEIGLAYASDAGDIRFWAMSLEARVRHGDD